MKEDWYFWKEEAGEVQGTLKFFTKEQVEGKRCWMSIQTHVCINCLNEKNSK